jgi:chemotaxis response regulator CheB
MRRSTTPAVDVLLRSAASTHERNVVAVLLSGTGYEGAAGLVAVHAHGGVVIVQEPEDATFGFMPRRRPECSRGTNARAARQLPGSRIRT